MVTKDDIEGFLDRMQQEGASYKEVEPGLWVVKPGGELDFDMVVHYSPPVVVLRVKVMELPKEKATLAELSRRLLELNASDLVHGSYGIEQNSNSIVLTEALELGHLDYEEFLSAYEGMTLALASHLREIGSLGTSGTHRVPGGNGKKKNARRVATKKSGNTKKKVARSAKRSGGRARGRR
jgi:hypothetical protein